MRLFLSVLAITFTTLQVSAQKTGIEKENWVEKPVLHKIAADLEKEPAVIIYDKRRIEWADEDKNELSSFYTIHKIVRVNDDRGIETFNKFYLGISESGQIVDIRARTILPNGKVIVLDKNNIKDQKEEDGSVYKIFAMEGLEKGCEIEYTYTFRKDAGFFGREIVQNEFPILNAEVELVSPSRLIFETKHFSGSPVSWDSIIGEKRFVKVKYQQVPGVEEEKYSFYRANLCRLEYKLSYNNARDPKTRVFTWTDLAGRVHSAYTSHSEKELKKVNDFIRSNKWDKLPSEKEKIVAVENLLKNTIANREDISSEDAGNIEKILKNKIASNVGLMRLYTAIFKQLNIPFQVGLSGNRHEFTVDSNFENWNNTDNILLYFPGQKKYLSPTRLEWRYPWIDPLWAGTNGLFCKVTTIGDYTTALAEIRQIPLEDYKNSSNNIEAKVSFTPKNDSLLIDLSQTYTGYSAPVYRASFNYASPEEQRLFMKELVKFNTNSEHILDSKLENEKFEQVGENNPFTLKATVKSNSLLEKAGNKILLKVGLLIGPQVEMYQEKPRQFPMELNYPHILYRKLSVEIPKGYTVKNIADLKIRKIYDEKNENSMSFVSDYRVDGNRIEIDIKEEYRKTYYPKEVYAHFRDVINAAADFNKIVLVFEKI